MITQDAIDQARRADLLTLAGVPLRKVAGTQGGEYAGPCPFCGGRDRFRVQPEHGRWYCRQCGGEHWHDAIDFIQRRDQAPFDQAVEILAGGLAMPSSAAPLPPAQPTPTVAPSARWQERARAFAEEAHAALWSDAGRPALRGLRARGLDDETIAAAGLGWNPQDLRQDRASWGLEGKAPIWLPRGVVIPWVIGGEVWRVNIRRPRADIAQGGPKYIGPAGMGNALYNADELHPGHPAVLVEGEIDALTIAQQAGDLAAAVATGSTHGARRSKWAARLALADPVLVAYDADEAGEKAAGYWLAVLGDTAHRWRPAWDDANAMAQAGADLRRWVAMGLASAANLRTFTALEAAAGRSYVELCGNPSDTELMRRYRALDDLWAAALSLPPL